MPLLLSGRPSRRLPRCHRGAAWWARTRPVARPKPRSRCAPGACAVGAAGVGVGSTDRLRRRGVAGRRRGAASRVARGNGHGPLGAVRTARRLGGTSVVGRTGMCGLRSML